VLAWSHLRLALATTEKKKSRIADIETTLKSVESAHMLSIIVDEKPANSVASRSEREFEVIF
jgi:hypothetical protein